MRKLLSLGVLAAIFAVAGTVSADEDEKGNTRTCEFKALNPLVLKVGGCVGNPTFWCIPVVTNTRTMVCIENSDFTRNERDCDGNLLKTVDVIPAALKVGFEEIVACNDGGASLEVKKLESDDCGHCFCVNPHRGGFWITMKLSAVGADICDDAGTYTATTTVTVSAQPFEDYKDID